MYKRIFMLLGILLLGIMGVLFFHGTSVREDTGRYKQSHTGSQYSSSRYFEPAVSGSPLSGKEKNDSAEGSPAAEEMAAPTVSEVNQPGSQSTVTNELPTLQNSIGHKYDARLQSLAATFEGKLNNLLGAALAEYTSATEKDPNADIGQLVNKYYYSGKALEAECDSLVYPVLEAFEKELSANGLPLDAALKAREEYEARKSARADRLIFMKP